MSSQLFSEDPELLTYIVNTEVSIAACLARYGLPKHSHYYRQFRKACEEVGVTPPEIDMSNNNLVKPKVPTVDLLIENSKSSTTNIKRRLINEGFLKNECYNCGIQAIWNDKPLSLHLEHKNGINNDNRLENLEILCPNCHSQTETYSGKNIKAKKKRNCKVCDKEITDGKYRKIHNECIKYKYKTEWPSIEELLTMIEETNYVQVGKKLGVSDNAVRKHIKNNMSPSSSG